MELYEHKCSCNCNSIKEKTCKTSKKLTDLLTRSYLDLIFVDKIIKFYGFSIVSSFSVDSISG